MSEENSFDAERSPFREGEPILIIDSRGKQHIVRLKAGHQSHHGRTGQIAHDSVIGLAPGLRVITAEGEWFLCIRPSLNEYLLKRLKRLTQIIYPKDLGTLLIEGNVYSGARVLEAGIGSASAALTFLRFLGPEGELISYENRPEFAEHSTRTIEDYQSLYGALPARHRVEIKDVYEGIAESDLDTVLLDVSEPHRAAPYALEALRTNGVMLCWVPTALQIHQLVSQLKEEPRWAQIKTTETLVRPWFVGPKSVRPSFRMVGHTGFLISARRVEVRDSLAV
jgi:tRNA (adenine57-N1/adenine58-N1)-methyltransferase